jgi:hypothetical protein
MKHLIRMSLLHMAVLSMGGCQTTSPSLNGPVLQVPAEAHGPESIWLWDALPGHLIDRKPALLRSAQITHANLSNSPTQPRELPQRQAILVNGQSLNGKLQLVAGAQLHRYCTSLQQCAKRHALVTQI